MFFRIESPSTNNMENSTNRSVSDNQMAVDGVLMQEKKDLTRTLNDETGLEESCLSHIRVIGERSYTSKSLITDEDGKEEMIETDMNNEGLEKFKNKELQKKSTTRFEEVGSGTIDVAELPKDFMTCTACGYVTDLKKIRKIQ